MADDRLCHALKPDARMTKQKPDMIVTTALFYANGSLHLGHMVEAIQADIWVRFQRLQRKHCLFFSGDDAHGTPIMLSSQKQGIDPETMIAQVHQEHQQDLGAFGIVFDQYHSTHSSENKAWTERIYHALESQSAIDRKTIHQAYDPEAKMFLPDRFVKGICPKCGAEDQYGDACEQCGATYDPLEMKAPKSIVSGATPITQPSEHFFFKLSACQDVIAHWLDNDALQPAVVNKLKEWLHEALKDWDISRDAPYFGFKIPNTSDKYFYVWLDAPIGYIAATEAYGQKHGLDAASLWSKDSTTPIYHFIGKDIVYFHGVFWPAVLHTAQLRTPTALFAHGFLTIDGKKMSKSRGTFITAQDYLQHFESEHLRYYFASKLNSSVEDLDLNWEDFIHKINVDLVGKIINIASRTAKFLTRHFDGRFVDTPMTHPLLDTFQVQAPIIANCYNEREFSQACRLLCALADQVNQAIADAAPWQAVKDETQHADVQRMCTLAMLCFRDLAIFLKPIMPSLVASIEAFLNVEPLYWDDLHAPLLNHQIRPYNHLMKRIPTDKANVFNATTPS